MIDLKKALEGAGFLRAMQRAEGEAFRMEEIREEIRKYGWEAGICPGAYEGCILAKSPKRFDETCSRSYGFCLDSFF